VNAGSVVLKIIVLAESLAASSVNLLRVRVTLETKTKRHSSQVRVHRDQVEIGVRHLEAVLQSTD